MISKARTSKASWVPCTEPRDRTPKEGNQPSYSLQALHPQMPGWSSSQKTLGPLRTDLGPSSAAMYFYFQEFLRFRRKQALKMLLTIRVLGVELVCTECCG